LIYLLAFFLVAGEVRGQISQNIEIWRERIARVNPTVTPVIDRFYFRSICFREPGGVLLELATDGPDFAVDEDVATLGERLSLPPFLESQRVAIEAQLRPITQVDLPVRV